MAVRILDVLRFELLLLKFAAFDEKRLGTTGDQRISHSASQRHYLVHHPTINSSVGLFGAQKGVCHQFILLGFSKL